MRVGSTSLPTLTIPRSAGRRHGWKPPYALPNAGEVVSISTNYASDVKPTILSAANWNYAVFGFYGGGCMVEDFSIGGAYVIAGSGGHSAPPNVGACVFDFLDATWKRVDNTNGVAYQVSDFLGSEVDDTYGEVLQGSPGAPLGCPAPAHLYANQGQRRSSQGGGQKGSFIRLRGMAAAIDSSDGSNHAHAMDLDTGLWTRLSTNAAINAPTCRASAYDPVNQRWYMPQVTLNDGLPIDYLRASDWTWTTASIATPANLGDAFSVFVHEGHRLMVIHTVGDQLRGIDLDDIAAGATTLTLSGSLPNGQEFSQWHFYPPDGCFYMFAGQSTTTTINKLRPPNLDADPLTAAWTVSTVTVGTALTKQPQVFIDSGAVHNTRFFFVPSINCFCWIPGDEGTTTTPVVILKPPA